MRNVFAAKLSDREEISEDIQLITLVFLSFLFRFILYGQLNQLNTTLFSIFLRLCAKWAWSSLIIHLARDHLKTSNETARAAHRNQTERWSATLYQFWRTVKTGPWILGALVGVWFSLSALAYHKDQAWDSRTLEILRIIRYRCEL